MDYHRDESLVKHALEMALNRRHPDPGLLYHSDRGSQFTNQNYGARLALAGIVMSMSLKGDFFDNAIMESLFSSFKVECVDGQTCQSCSQAR
jgi:putative transposase